MENKFLLLLLFTYSMAGLANCEYSDVTGNPKEREKLYKLKENSGYRLSLNGMKEYNKEYGTGTVDRVIDAFGAKLCGEFQDSDIEVKIIKMDYKGYHVSCSPEAKCENTATKLRNVKQNFFTEDGKVLKEKLSTSVEKGDNYIDGYMRSRAKTLFSDYSSDVDLNKFLKEKLDINLKDVFGVTNVKDVDMNGPVGKELSRAIDVYRTGDPSKLPKKMRNLIEVLDAMEVPYQGSNNFDDELTEALKSDTDGKSAEVKTTNKGQYDVATARGGDDMTLVVKKDGQVSKIVGADARGLGKMNFWTRLEVYVEESQAGDVDDLVTISKNGIKVADHRMLKTMDVYQAILDYNLKNLDTDDMDEIIRASHDTYNKLVTGQISMDDPPASVKFLLAERKIDHIFDEDLMPMRTGAINTCNLNNQCVKDRITDIHNTLKLMEKAGIDGHFGDSCIGVEYWSRKLDAKSIQSLD